MLIRECAIVVRMDQGKTSEVSQTSEVFLWIPLELPHGKGVYNPAHEFTTLPRFHN